MVADYAATLGIAHHTLTWSDWDGVGNMQDQARQARYGLMGEFVRSHEFDGLAVGHTADDQAETVLMRMARKAGVDGLAAMRRVSKRGDLRLYRPLLGVRRADLQAFLTAQNVAWVDDPSNDDPAYERVRVRNALSVLEPLGIDIETLTVLAQNAQDALVVLEHKTSEVMRDIAKESFGAVSMDAQAFMALPRDLRRRCLLRCIKWVGRGDYPPRAAALARVLAGLEYGEKAVLNGCVIQVAKGNIWVSREYTIVAEVVAEKDTLWDGRWQVRSTLEGHVGAMGDAGLKACAEWRDAGIPRDVAIVTPAIWHDGTVAVSAINSEHNDTFVCKGAQETLFATHLTH